MLRALLTGDSLLCSRFGWNTCDKLSSTEQILGVDRHGKLEFAKISLEKKSKATKVAFLGTSQCCGIFSGESVVQDIDGKKRTVLGIVGQMVIGDLRFEVARNPSHSTIPNECDIESFWAALASEAVSKQESKLWLRLRQSCEISVSKPSDTKAWTFEARGHRVYGQIRKAQLRDLLRAGKATEVIAGLVQVFRNDDNFCQVRRGACLLAMLICDYSAHKGKGSLLTYDSMQHSVHITVEMTHERQMAVARGLCACIVPGEVPVWEVTWEANTWNPISGGIVLAGQ
jgi:hypothetical protein